MGTLTHALTVDQFRRYMEVIDQVPDRELPAAAVCAVVVGTGARLSEVRGMDVGDLFGPDGKPLERVSRTLSKKRSANPVRKTVFFPWDEVGSAVIRWHALAVRRFFRRADEPLFSVRWGGQPLSELHCWRRNKVFLERAGINPAGVGLHGIRKTFLTVMYYRRLEAEPGNMMGALRYVQDLAGHGTFEVTLRYLADQITTPHHELVTDIFNRIKHANKKMIE